MSDVRCKMRDVRRGRKGIEGADAQGADLDQNLCYNDSTSSFSRRCSHSPPLS